MDGMIKTNKAMRKALAAENAKWPAHLVEMPRDTWPCNLANLCRVLRSRDYLVQIYRVHEAGRQLAVYRMSVNSTSVDAAANRWTNSRLDWDTLQRLKREAGYGDMWAVEVFPPDQEVINVSNMRHLWLLAEKPAYAW